MRGHAGNRPRSQQIAGHRASQLECLIYAACLRLASDELDEALSLASWTWEIAHVPLDDFQHVPGRAPNYFGQRVGSNGRVCNVAYHLDRLSTQGLIDPVDAVGRASQDTRPRNNRDHHPAASLL